MVDGQVPSKAAFGNLTRLVPPSMHATIQAKVDRLPLAPGVVLRYACVWGGHFHTGALLEMLPSGLVYDLKELEEVLEMLADEKLILRNTSLGCCHVIAGDAGTAWEVRGPVLCGVRRRKTGPVLGLAGHQKSRDKGVLCRALPDVHFLSLPVCRSSAIACSRTLSTASCRINTAGRCTGEPPRW